MRVLTPLLACSIAAPSAVKVEKAAYKGWAHCYRLMNGEVELVVTSDVGPRIIRLRDGHQVWKAPEDR